MIRKLQVVGKKTYSINLPKPWIISHNLGRGSPILMEEQDDGSLVLKKYEEEIVKKQNITQLNIGDENLNIINRKITKAYLLGFEQIEIKSTNAQGMSKDLMNQIEMILKKYPGTEIMSQGRNYVLVEVIASFDNSPHKLIMRMFNLTDSMLEGIERLFHEDYSWDGELSSELERIRRIDTKINRAFFLTVRQIRALMRNLDLRKDLHVEMINLMDYRLICHLLENIGDTIKEIVDIIDQNRHIMLRNILNKSRSNGNKNGDESDVTEESPGYSLLATFTRSVKQFHDMTFDSFSKTDEKMAGRLITEASSFLMTHDMKKIMFDMESEHEKPFLTILTYRFNDIIRILIDICDLIQS